MIEKAVGDLMKHLKRFRLPAALVLAVFYAMHAPGVLCGGEAGAASQGPVPPGDQAGDSPATLQFEFAERLYFTRLYRSAIPEYERFRKEFPSNPRMPEALLHLGQSMFHVGRYGDAAAVFTELITRHATSPLAGPAYLARGHCRLLAGEVRETINDLKRFLTLAPPPDQTAEAKYLLGRGYRLLNDRDSARVTFEEVVVHAPTASVYRPMSLFQLGELAVEEGDVEQALALNARIIREFPENPLAAEAQLKNGSILMQEGRYEEALAAYGSVQDDRPQREAALLGASQALHAMERYAEAIEPCRELLERYPDGDLVPQALYQLGVCQLALKLYDESAETFSGLAERFADHEYGEKAAAAVVLVWYQAGAEHAEQVLQAAAKYLERYHAGPSVGQVHFCAGEAFLWRKRFDRAIESYRRVPTPSALAGEAAFRMAVAHEVAGRTNEAATAYDAFLADFPDHPRRAQALFAAGAAYQRLKATAEAKARYARLMEEFPDSPLAARALYETAMCDYLPGDAEALARMRDGLRLHLEEYPDGVDAGSAHYWLGYHASQVEKDYEKALVHYERAAELPGRFQKEARLRIAETLYSEGREKESAERFLELINQSPELVRNQEVYIYVGSTFRKLGNPERAVVAYERLLERHPDTAWRDKALYELGNLCADLPEPNWERSRAWFEELIRHYEEMKKEDPNAATPLWYAARFGLGRALRALGRPQDARPLLEEAWKNAENRRVQFSAQLALADMEFEGGKFERARDLFLPVGILYDDPVLSSEALYKAGKCLVALDASDEGLLLWDDLAKRYPQSPWTARAQSERQSIPRKAD